MKYLSVGIIFFILFFFSSCEKRGDSILQKFSEDELIELLVDVTLARSAVSGWPSNLADSIKTEHYSTISQLHLIEKQELYEILESLSYQPEYFQRLLNSAADSLRTRNDKLKISE